jgi:hypothetical protein
MRLWGTVNMLSGESFPADRCYWLIDEREAARGLDSWVEAPQEGEHRCTLIVEAPEGRVEVSTAFRTLDPASITWVR